MKEDALTYKDFSGSVEYSADDNLLVGRVLDIESLIMYSGISVPEIEAAFREAVDDYLTACERNSAKPEKAYTGTFNVRVGGELHRAAAIAARRRGQTLNELVTQAVAAEVSKDDRHPPVGNMLTISSGVTESDFSWDALEQVLGVGDFDPDDDEDQNEGRPIVAVARHHRVRALPN